jgi:outer membrane lipoprotein-sorting protein
MKKIIFVLAGLIAVTAVNAQTLNEIVKNYSTATKQDKLASVKTIKITAKMSAMGMEMPMTMYMKNPNKIKTVISFNGQDMVTTFDGEKGYMINPMTGSTDPVEMTGSQLKQAQANNAFSNQILTYFKNGKLTLEGQENVNDKPAFKLKANEGTTPIFLYLDKSTYMLVKLNATVDQMGTQTNVDTFMSDYTEIDGVILPKKTTIMSNGMEAGVLTYDKIEVNIPIEDSIFKLK